LKLRQLDLHLGLAGTSASSEDVEDELRTIENTNTDQILQGFALRRCELIVEDHEIRLSGGYTFPKLVGLTLSDVEARMGVVEPLADDVYDLTARGVGQPCQLLQMFLSGALREGLEGSPHQHHPFYDRAVVDQLRRNVPPFPITLLVRRGVDEKAALSGQIFEVGPVVHLGTVEDLFQQVSEYFAELGPGGKPHLLEVGAVQGEIRDRERGVFTKNRPERVDAMDHVQLLLLFLVRAGNCEPSPSDVGEVLGANPVEPAPKNG
jgi:hypothetical protein